MKAAQEQSVDQDAYWVLRFEMKMSEYLAKNGKLVFAINQGIRDVADISICSVSNSATMRLQEHASFTTL
jgi:hypothetical protein